MSIPIVYKILPFAQQKPKVHHTKPVPILYYIIKIFVDVLFSNRGNPKATTTADYGAGKL